MIQVLVVEDSPLLRELLCRILSSDPEIEVLAAVGNGQEALSALKSYSPDVITMDIHMPGMDGVEATRAIMQTRPTPIVIVSASVQTQEAASAFRALAAGALAIVEKPVAPGVPGYEEMAANMVRTVKLAAEVKVVRRWKHPPGPKLKRMRVEPVVKGSGAEVRLVALGASTGGPQVLQTILAGLSRDFSAPVLVVQHITHGFTDGFVEWLASSSPLPVLIPKHGEQIRTGHVYVAPEHVHMKVERGETISLSSDGPSNGHRPSVSVLFHSVAEVFGGDAVGVLLTGMGKDGAAELKRMREKGAVTIVQDLESSVVPGMPGEAIRLGAASHILPPSQIAPALNQLAAAKARV